MPELEDILRANGIASVKINLHAEAGTSIHYWHFWLDRIFWKTGVKPDLFVIPFWGGNLADSDRLELDGLAQLIENPPGLRALLNSGIAPGPEMAQIVIAKYWKTFAFRKQIKKRFLISALPGYADFMTDVNTVNFRHTRQTNALDQAGVSTYASLDAFLKRAREADAKVCFVAYPMRPRDDGIRPPLDSELTRRIVGAGMKLVDVHDVPELIAANYNDRVHLRVPAVPRWTRLLGEAIASQVKAGSARE